MVRIRFIRSCKTAENHGLTYRIVEENGQSKMVTMDLVE
jgi:hypothetical protein